MVSMLLAQWLIIFKKFSRSYTMCIYDKYFKMLLHNYYIILLML
jgi:hypothetical protein